MLKQKIVFEVLKGEKNERVHSYSIPEGCSLGEIHDVLFQFRSLIVEKMQEALKADAPKPAPEPAMPAPEEVKQG
jgi:hypothetical protein